MDNNKNQPMKILYVCPFAHYGGHYSSFVSKETLLLSNSGQEVFLLTFEGLLSKDEPKTLGNYYVLRRGKNSKFSCFLLDRGRNFLATKWFLMFIEYFFAIAKALRLRKKLDCHVIHIRDGEPFIFAPFLLSIFSKGVNFTICLVADPFNKFKYSGGAKNIFKNVEFFILDKFINTKLWYPIYKLSLSRNNFALITDNEQTKASYEKYQGGVFSKKVFCVPLISQKLNSIFSKKEARKYLGLPENGFIFLSFGSAHIGKDLATIFEAIKNVPEARLIHAGKTSFPKSLSLNYAGEIKSGKFIIKDYYIPENDKKYYFFSADAVVLSYVKNFQQTASILWDACSFRDLIIASDYGEPGSLVKKFNLGFLFTPQNSDSLREVIVKFLNTSEDEKKKMIENCEKFNSNYSSQRWTENILKIYSQFPKYE